MRAPVSSGRMRRVRDHRLADYHAFEHRLRWSVLGMHQDLSRRYPVEPLLGASSAQAELALEGNWGRWQAVVASVLVRSGVPTGDRRHHDLVVQLTLLDTGPLRLQFTAANLPGGVEVGALAQDSERDRKGLQQAFDAAARTGTLRLDDRLAANDIQLLHTRRLLDDEKHVDIEGPLKALTRIAEALAS